ncbi:MAG: hypothetical protein Q9164_007438 [Protoblastenia rupestris]
MITNPSSQLKSLHTHTSLSTTPSSRGTVQAWLERTATPIEASISHFLRKRKRSKSLSPPLTETSTLVNKRVRRSTSAPTEANSTAMPGDMSPPTPPASRNLAASPQKSPSTQSVRSGKSKVNTSDPGEVSRRMEQYGLLQHSEAFERKYPAFKAMVMKMIKGDRSSAMKPGSAKEIQKNAAIYGTHNEDTFLTEVLPLLIKKTYAIPADPRQRKTYLAGQAIEETHVEIAGKDVIDGGQYEAKRWVDEGVITITNREFIKDFLPCPFPDALRKLLKKKDDMVNGKPDRCYGLKTSLFPRPNDLWISLELNEYLGVMTGIYHPFLILEGKSNQGKAADAQNQARRGGAILVHSLRLLLSKVGVSDVKGADERTYAFSLTMTPDHIQLWVHWAEVLEGETLFHMNYLKGIDILDQEQLPDMRKYIDNILEWGSGIRVTQLKGYHTTMHKWQRGEMERMEREQRAHKDAENARKRARTASSSVLEGGTGFSQ